ncbi:proteasome activating protein 200 [Striga hermonthica]|uniref:Proteasome activating protein 200 n=1 Tax=Striga hermonthica TaxID=68872 RepID=A0A9N7NIL0_STRHE|nr:proteasome activating protein 200 [Striga hermonthica]
MHLHNAWLPPPVAEETKREKHAFAGVVNSVKESYNPEDPESVYSTLKWVSVIDLFVKAKSDLSVEDVTTLVEVGLELFHVSENKLYAQVRWGNILVKLLNKYRKKLSLKVQWRPLYNILIHTHFTRNTGPEGWRLRQRHFETVTSLVRSCRRFFPQGSASEIWSEFRSLLENPWHNAAFEGAGFVRLFLPTNVENQDFFNPEWIRLCLDHWASIPNCQFWNSQWASVTARVIKSYPFIEWEHFLPDLFSIYLNIFEVPVANGSGSYPFPTDVPRNTRFLFANRSITPSKAIAKSIVYLLNPGSSAQRHFEELANLLEQYYHPSNGGRWTYSLERFLFHLVVSFRKRLQHEQLNNTVSKQSEIFLAESDRGSFVKTVLKFIDRGQYSKNEQLSETVASTTSILSYVEPSLVLPFMASRFHMALETMTATHQLKSAVTSVAFAGRSLIFSSLLDLPMESTMTSGYDSYADLLVISLSNALLGMDANDPPKTLATMQLIGSLFSSMSSVDDNINVGSLFSSFHFSEWLDEFLCRLFALLQHLEPSSVLNEGTHTPASSGTFLVEEGPYYFCMLEILLGRLSDTLYKQALKKISKFVLANILPGAIAEVGLLCCACVHSNPQEAVAQLVKPILESVISALKAAPTSGFGTRSTYVSSSIKEKSTLSPALETAIEYKLKVLSVAICYGGPSLIQFRDQFKEVIASAFDSTSWKVNGAGDHVLRSLLGSLVHYYPVDQYKCVTHHPFAASLEQWIDTKDFSLDKPAMGPKWHVPTEEEINLANELLMLHFESALDDLLTICRSKIHSDPGDEKDHLKVTLLRVDSSLQGVLSCLPDFRPSSDTGMVKEAGRSLFVIAGATGSCVGSSELREKAADVIHETCKYLLKEKSDDSILLLLLIRVMDTLGNYGSSEYEEWSNHRQAWKLESTALVEPPINFIVSSHSKGKRRPRWALIDKSYMHNTWRSSQSSYHLSRASGNIFPSDRVICLMDDLLDLCLHSYETVRRLAAKSILKMMKRWPSTILKCVVTLSENLRNPSLPEYAVLGSCAVLSSQTVLKRLTTERKALSSFLIGVLFSSHHESIKAQKAITELFVKYNIHFSGLSRSIFGAPGNHTDGPSFADLVAQIGSMSFESSNLHWRYNLMANRVLLLLAMASSNDPNVSPKVVSEIAGHFLKNLKSQLPQTRILAISALNTLLKESPYKYTAENCANAHGYLEGDTKSSLEGALSDIFQEDGFFSETLNSLSHVHIITDMETSPSRGHYGSSTMQSFADKSITRFYFDFSASWPRTPSWISLFGNDTFYSNFARIFKRLIQECGMPVLLALRTALEEFVDAKERSKQCVAAEAFAGVLHSDVFGVSEAWDSWMVGQLQNIIHAPTVESIPEWVASIRYAVTGKGKSGTRAPLLRHKVIDCLMKPLSQTVTSAVVSKRYTFLSAVLIEIYPPRMSKIEIVFHYNLLVELLNNMSHSSAQVREAIGVTLSVLCSNLRLCASFGNEHLNAGVPSGSDVKAAGWDQYLVQRATELVRKIQNVSASETLDMSTDNITQNGMSTGNTKDDIRWMETLFHFIISTLKSGRSPVMQDVIVELLYPVISLQETSNKDLSNLAKAAFELLKWRVSGESHLQKAVPIILSLASDANWRTRSATLTFLRSFMYRHAFILSNMDKLQIWQAVEKLLTDNQLEVREHAAAVLAGLMKSGDQGLVEGFRQRAYEQASAILKKRKNRKVVSTLPVASLHGSILALAACVLSVPYDMPRWLPEHVTLLARFVSEPSPLKSTVTKAIAEFRRTHADTWNVHKDSFTEEQLEVLADTSSSSSYFA